jgi:hypothetical protein
MEARPLFERSLQAQAVAEIDCKLADLGRHLKGNPKPPFQAKCAYFPLTVGAQAPVYEKGEK